MMQDAPEDIAAIEDYHMHVYYDPASGMRAALLRQWVERTVPRKSAWGPGTINRLDRTSRRCIRLQFSPICCPSWCRS